MDDWPWEQAAEREGEVHRERGGPFLAHIVVLADAGGEWTPSECGLDRAVADGREPRVGSAAFRSSAAASYFETTISPVLSVPSYPFVPVTGSAMSSTMKKSAPCFRMIPTASMMAFDPASVRFPNLEVPIRATASVLPAPVMADPRPRSLVIIR